MKNTVLKWFDLLLFPSEWKDAVTDGLKTFDLDMIEANDNPYAWLYTQEDKMQGLIYALYKCEDFFEKGKAMGISEDILMETMQEVRRHAQNYHRTTKGEKIGIYQIRWVGTVLSGRLYCLGRLEFEMKTTKRTWEGHGVVPGDKVIGLHIPRTGGRMSNEDVESSLKKAAEFFPKYFPDFDYKCYVCHSWLLDPTLKLLLPPDSNIIKFLNRFEITDKTESASGLGSIFGSGTNYENVLAKTPETALQKAAYEHIKNGGKLYEAHGFMEK